MRIHFHGLTDVHERKGPFLIVCENPVFRIFEETIGVLSPQNGIFLKAFDRI